MISEDLTNQRALVTTRLMGSLADSVDSFLKAGDATGASKMADSLTLLIVKTYEVEAMNNVADSAAKISRSANHLSQKHRLGELD